MRQIVQIRLCLLTVVVALALATAQKALGGQSLTFGIRLGASANVTDCTVNGSSLSVTAGVNTDIPWAPDNLNAGDTWLVEFCVFGLSLASDGAYVSGDTQIGNDLYYDYTITDLGTYTKVRMESSLVAAPSSFGSGVILRSGSRFYGVSSPNDDLHTFGTIAVGSNDADLSSLTTSAGTLSPSFTSGTTSYSASVANSTASISVTPTTSQQYATVTVNGVAVNSGTASQEIALNVGQNTVVLATTAQDGTTQKTYSLLITRQHSISMTDVERELDAGSFTITDPSSASSGAFSYSISNSGVATISGNTVTPVGIGSATVTATQAADSTYASASTTFTLTVTENGTSVTSCSDAAARASHYIATGNSGYCGGSLTKAAAYIYEIWLGDSSTGMTASCRIWGGTLPVMRHQYQAGEKAQGGPIDVKNCSDGTYDTIHLIKSRYLQFAGYASYPAPSGSASHGSTARSTTTFATSNADHAVLVDWLEDSTGFAASSRPYVRTTSSATSIYKKLAAQPSSSDLASSSNADMYFDEYKRLTASQNNTSSGWLCEGASSQAVCAQILSNDTNRLEWRYTNAASEVSGLPITLSNAKGCSLTIDLSYKSADTSNNQNTGINFLWRNNSGTVEMVGVKPDDGDINISLGKPKC